MAIQLHDCIISKRGKGAKGTVVVKTFGIPVKRKADKKTGVISKVTKAWDYGFADKMALQAIIDGLEAAGLSNLIIKKALLIGADTIRKSNTIQANSEIAQIAVSIMAQGLAQDEANAKAIAKEWLQYRAMCAKHGNAIPSYETLAEGQKKIVADLKKKGLWEASKPRLVKKTEEEVSDIVEDESEEDSDDTEENTEESAQ
jgi:hypothetical protein